MASHIYSAKNSSDFSDWDCERMAARHTPHQTNVFDMASGRYRQLLGQLLVHVSRGTTDQASKKNPPRKHGVLTRRIEKSRPPKPFWNFLTLPSIKSRDLQNSRACRRCPRRGLPPW